MSPRNSNTYPWMTKVTQKTKTGHYMVKHSRKASFGILASCQANNQRWWRSNKNRRWRQRWSSVYLNEDTLYYSQVRVRDDSTLRNSHLNLEHSAVRVQRDKKTIRAVKFWSNVTWSNLSLKLVKQMISPLLLHHLFIISILKIITQMLPSKYFSVSHLV